MDYGPPYARNEPIASLTQRFWLVANIGESQLIDKPADLIVITRLMEPPGPDRVFRLRRANLCRPHSSPIPDRHN